MLKPYQPNHCCVCEKLFELEEIRNYYEGNTYCIPCYNEASEIGEKLVEFSKSNGHVWGDVKRNEPLFNKPTHYHTHQMDTIKFLQEGFPPDVFEGFAIGHIIKYIQRYQYKGGREDLVKAADYANRLLDWHDKSRS